MPVTVYRLQEEPIIIAEIDGHLTLDDAQSVYNRTEDLRQDMPAKIYRITDVSKTTTSFADIISVIKNAARQGNSSTNDPTVTVVFVGKSQWSRLFTDAMRQKQFGEIQIPIFASRDEALDYVRSLIETAADNDID